METATITNWESLSREDLKMIPTMIAKGFNIVFNPQDVRAGRTTPELIPLHGVTFVKGDLHVWGIIKNNISCWQTATLIDNHFCHHTPIKDLTELFK